MDEQRFDRFVKAVAVGRTRRGVLRSLTAALATSLLVLLEGRGLVRAKDKDGPCKHEKDCAAGRTCVNGTCTGAVFTGTCQVGQDFCDPAVFNTVPCGPDCYCIGTAGVNGAPACVRSGAFCQDTPDNPCASDRDCQKRGFGPTAVCIPVSGDCCIATRTLCAVPCE